MSVVYFHSPSWTAELRGSERAWLGSLVTNVALGLLKPSQHHEQLLPLVNSGHYAAHPDQGGPGWLTSWANTYSTAFSVSWDDRTPLIQYEGNRIAPFTLALNTAHVVGSDQLKLAARLHGQCEIHAWVDGPNRAWLADIMQAGVDSGIYRRGFWVEGVGETRMWSDQGWDAVIEMLRARDDEPVVTSYSVRDSFPTSAIGDWTPASPDDHDAWYGLDAAEQWRISMAGLRAASGHLELRPDDWGSYHFGHGLTVLDLIAPDSEDRLAKAFGPQEVSES
jgi:hypothetical protein